MVETRPNSRRHAPRFVALALAACGGGGGGGGSVAIVSGAGTAAPTATPTPTPTPTSTATPTPTPTVTTSGGASVPSPSLAGLDPIASGIDVSQYLVSAQGTGAIPGQDAGDVVGSFRMLCAPSHNAYDDPIVYPGQAGKAHLHTFFGNTGANASSTYKSLRTTGESTCNNLLNRSAYWVPSLMNGRGKVVMPDYLVVYYKRRPASDPACKTMGKECIQLPRGLRYIFGHNMTSPANGSPTSKYWWNCDGPGGASGHFSNIAQAAKGCPAGARIGIVLVAPSCWNGEELDTPDHRSHMAYTSYGADGKERCPATHPYVIPEFTLGVWYTTDGTLDRSGNESADADTWYLSSDRMPGMPNAVPGTTAHADWFGAWEDSILSLWHANCINKQLSCHSGDLGNGQQLAMNAGYAYGNKTVLVDRPPKP